jgi:Na+/proline symporter
LLFVYYQKDPTFLPKDDKGNPIVSDIFGSYILNVMPVGVRGLVLAGIFATAMGSFSAALNALATSATNDWYIPYRPKQTEAQYVQAAKGFTVLFAVLMVIIATAFAALKVSNPGLRIIPLVLGIASYIVGPMLGVFLLGMFTKNRGSDLGNVVAVIVGLLTTGFLGDLPARLTNDNTSVLKMFPFVPTISFTWFALIGAVVVFLVGLFFRTPAAVLERARRKEETGEGVADERPIYLRDEDV